MKRNIDLTEENNFLSWSVCYKHTRGVFFTSAFFLLSNFGAVALAAASSFLLAAIFSTFSSRLSSATETVKWLIYIFNLLKNNSLVLFKEEHSVTRLSVWFSSFHHFSLLRIFCFYSCVSVVLRRALLTSVLRVFCLHCDLIEPEISIKMYRYTF